MEHGLGRGMERTAKGEEPSKKQGYRDLEPSIEYIKLRVERIMRIIALRHGRGCSSGQVHSVSLTCALRGRRGTISKNLFMYMNP